MSMCLFFRKAKRMKKLTTTKMQVHFTHQYYIKKFSNFSPHPLESMLFFSQLSNFWRVLHNKNTTVYFSDKNHVLYLYYTSSKRMGAVVHTGHSRGNLLRIQAKQCNQSKIHSLGCLFHIQSVYSQEKKKKKIRAYIWFLDHLNKIKEFLALLHLSLRYTNGKTCSLKPILCKANRMGEERTKRAETSHQRNWSIFL